jgi:hypothetical protein
MAYDGARRRTMLFGGNSLQTLLGDTWHWDGEDWTQVADTGPSPRSGHAVAYDGGRSALFLFGGHSSGDALNGDTWRWDGEGWTQVADTGPAPRTGHQLAFDSGRARVVLFGGEIPGAGARGDTWEWDGEAWTQVDDMGPAPRANHAMAFDGGRARVVVFGGKVDGAAGGDTWEWDGTSWTQLADFGPNPCMASAMTFDGSSTLLFGGIDPLSNANVSPRIFGLTWEWNGEHWTERQDIGPAPRWGHVVAFDSGRGQVVLFGGGAVGPADPAAPDHLLGDTWEVPGAAVQPQTEAKLASFTINPNTVSGTSGGAITAQVTLDAPAQAPTSVDIRVGPRSAATIMLTQGSQSGQGLVSVVPADGPIGSALVLEASCGGVTMTAVVTVTE